MIVKETKKELNSRGSITILRDQKRDTEKIVLEEIIAENFQILKNELICNLIYLLELQIRLKIKNKPTNIIVKPWTIKIKGNTSKATRGLIR